MLDLLLRRRSIRKYEDRPIDRDILDKILLGALTSPSSNNRKPWELVVVEEKEKLSKLGASRGAASAPITRAPMAIVAVSYTHLSNHGRIIHVTPKVSGVALSLL